MVVLPQCHCIQLFHWYKAGRSTNIEPPRSSEFIISYWMGSVGYDFFSISLCVSRCVYSIFCQIRPHHELVLEISGLNMSHDTACVIPIWLVYSIVYYKQPGPFSLQVLYLLMKDSQTDKKALFIQAPFLYVKPVAFKQSWLIIGSLNSLRVSEVRLDSYVAGLIIALIGHWVCSS